ncbi:MAG: tRNA (guanosine(37)-N1)-methyltransferase TrmD [Bacteroidales bacterium]|nr:tRNA (guanosine(37)-N1)-methyltransferase TrmD [Bacteroidales bacterium]
MRIDIITLFPEMFTGPFDHSIVKRAQTKGLVEIYLHQLRDFATNKYRRVDDYPFGGEAGMVMMIEPIVNCIEQLTEVRAYDEIIFTTPDGQLFNQKEANTLSLKQNIIILCGHYKGVDERVREHFITKEYSIGDFVLSGGEIPAMLITDAIARLIPGVIGDETSALNDSFQNELLSYPVYTRPAEFRGWKVPEILLSGHDAKIAEWKQEQAVLRTNERRPELTKIAKD